MTDEQIERYKALLAAGKFSPDRHHQEYAFQRGHNNGVTFAEEQLAKVLKGEDAA